MCGIGICIGCTTQPEDEMHAEVDVIRESIQNRGPDSICHFYNDDLNTSFISSVLSLRGMEVVSQPLISSTNDIFLWNGEIFGGYNVLN